MRDVAGCVVCGVAGRAVLAPLQIAGLLCDVCAECGPLVASIPSNSWGAVQTCLHLAACEIEREAEAKATPADVETLRRMQWLFRDGRYRQRCECATCRAVARGERKEPWGPSVDYLTGEVFPDIVAEYEAARSASVRDDDSAFGVVWRDARGHDEKEALKRLYQMDTAYPAIVRGSLRARARPVRRGNVRHE